MTGIHAACANGGARIPPRGMTRAGHRNGNEEEESEGAKLNTYRGGPDERGFFGLFGGRFVAETLMPLILELERAYEAAKADPASSASSTTSTPTTPAGRARSISPSG